MKKIFNFISYTILSLAFVLCLTSCFNLFSKDDDSALDETTVTFTGFIEIDSKIGQDLIARSASPSISLTGAVYETYEYKVSALRTKHSDGTTDGVTTADASIDAINKSFEIGLNHGEWKIDVFVQKKNQVNTAILSDSYTVTLDSATQTTSPTFTHVFFLKPVVADPLSPATKYKGTVKLAMSLQTYITKLKVEEIVYQDDSATATLLGEYPLSITQGHPYSYAPTEEFDCGSHNLRFTFYKGETVVFATEQTINVLRGLETNKWVGGTSILISSSGQFNLTQGLINAWRRRTIEYYVGGAGASDTDNYGSSADPLATIKYAISLINDIDYGTNVVKIHVAEGVTENLSERLIINSGKKVLIDVWNTEGTSDAPKILRQDALGGAMIEVQNGAELTIDGISIDGNNVSSAGNCGIHNEGTFTLKSGEIINNENVYTPTTKFGAAIYNAGTLNLFGGSITGNKMTNAGVTNNPGGVYIASGTVNLSGAVTIKGNSPSNLYLASGKKITITGPLEEGTNKSEIYISTEDQPSKNTSITFTNGYGFYGSGHNAGKYPGRYFIGENATVTYKHATDVTAPEAGDGEAQLAVSAGQIIDPLSDIDVTFSLSKNKFMEGADASEALRTIKIIPKYIINDTPLSGTALETALAETNWKINMYVGDKPITGCSWTDPTIVIPATVTYHDSYTLIVRATYKGITFDQEFVINDSSPFVQVPAYSWTGSAEEVAALTPTSNVFIAGRTLNIPSLIACDHEVTQGEYEKYMTYYGVVRNNERMPNDTYGIGENYPAYYVCWYEAVMYCNLRSEAEGLTPAYYLGTDAGGSKITSVDTWASLGGQYYISKTGTGSDTRYYFDSTSSSSKLNYNGPTDTDGGIQFDETANGWRLPTEIEWEYLARGENSFEYSYSGSNSLAEVGWYTENSGGKTHVVKSKESNSLGLYDMSGNVWEWCWDIFATSLSISAETPSTGPESGSGYHSIRGCSFNSSETPIADRNHSFDSGIRYSDLGFRVVRTITE